MIAFKYPPAPFTSASAIWWLIERFFRTYPSWNLRNRWRNHQPEGCQPLRSPSRMTCRSSHPVSLPHAGTIPCFGLPSVCSSDSMLSLWERSQGPHSMGMQLLLVVMSKWENNISKATPKNDEHGHKIDKECAWNPNLNIRISNPTKRGTDGLDRGEMSHTRAYSRKHKGTINRKKSASRL